MKLYYSPGACSLAPHIVLREAGVVFELVRVDLRTHQTEHGIDFATITPKGYVPALELDNGAVLTEGPAIVQYLADVHPGAALAPVAGTLERAQLQAWLNFIATELHKSFLPLFKPDAAPASQDEARQTLTRRFALVAQALTQHPYLLGERFGVADAYLFAVLGWCRLVKFDLTPWPVFAAYRERIALRPAVQAALQAEGLVRR